jgi:PAS domain S-box-containing protein
MLMPFRRVRPMDVAAAAYATAYVGWLALRVPGTPRAELVGNLFFVPLGLTVAWASWNISTRGELDGRTRTAWRLLALSAAMLWVSGTGWSAYLLASGGDEWPAWIDHLEIAHTVVVVAAMLVFPGRRLEGRRRARFLFDASLMLVAGFVLTLYYGLSLQFASLRGDPLENAVLGPGLDLVVFLIAAIASLQKRDRGTRAALVCLALAGAAYVAANYYYTLAADGVAGFEYHPGDAVDGLWFAAWILRWLAARVALHHYERERVTAPPPGDVRSVGYDRSMFSYLIVGGTFVVLAGQVFRAQVSPPVPGAHDFLPVLAVCVALMVALILARQMVELRENNRLFAEQLRQESRFRSFVQHSSDVVLIVDAGGVISYASPTVRGVFGEDSPVRPGACLLDLVHEDDGASLAAILAPGPGSRRIRLRLPASDGALRDIEAVWTDLRADPAVNGLVVNCRDVTERNELERRLRHSQKLDAVGHLAGGLAHDLNNALAIISGYVDLLKAQVPAGSGAADDLAHVRQAVERAATVTRKVLAFSRRQPVLRQSLDLNAVVRDMLGMLRQTVRPTIEVVLRLGDGLWPVRADRGQIEQVLVNLAANARDAMAEGGVLEISTANRPSGSLPSMAELQPGDHVSLVVRDTGVGMGPEVLERVFEPFFSTKTDQGGMGLGLAMVHGTVLDSGGRILVESDVGRGSSFTILLPRTEVPVIREEGSAQHTARPDRRLTVLLVDDEDQVRAVTRRLLEHHGYAVVEAESGGAALDVLANRSVALDVLLTDLVMPGIHGRQLIARCGELRPSLPVICMTGFAGDGDDPTHYGGRLVTLLSKPFSARDLERAVAAAASRRSAT